MVKVALMGHGVVGSGVAEIFYENLDVLEKRAHTPIRIEKILDLREFPDSPYADRFTKDFQDIVSDESIRVVVEVMGGLHPAYEFVKQCLEANKSVVTSNKELVAEKGAELLRIAAEHNVNFMFEASVGGGIPIIRPIHQCLAANNILSVSGILNGTTNFILTKMIDDNMQFEDALALAQKLGYAERDPSADVDGDDACRKICILAALSFGKHVYPNQVYTEGIRNISLDDVAYADAWGGAIKLIGQAKKLADGNISILVCPMLVRKTCQLSTINDVFNGILVKGDYTDEVLFYGKGAGKLPTASAVVADVLDCIKHLDTRKFLFWEDNQDGSYIQAQDDNEFAYYILLNNVSEEQACKAFGDIERIVRPDGNSSEVAIVTQVMTEGTVRKILSELTAEKGTVKSLIRVAEI